MIDGFLPERGNDVSDIGTDEASKRWGYSQETVRKWCAIGLIKGAMQDKKGSPWHIPQNAECPKKIKINSDML